jgi:NTE family protein
MRILVLAGGGSKGAFACGVLEVLCAHGLTWDAVIGCSTGALIAPSLALGEIATLVDVYSHVTNADIYREREPYEFLGHRSLYDWTPLWGLINRYLPYDAYPKLATASTAVYLLTTYMQGGCAVYWATRPPTSAPAGYAIEPITDHTTLTRAMLASASQPVFFPLVEIRDNDHQQYCDGGVVSVAPVMLARDLGATTIEVILLSPPDEAPPVQTVYSTFLATAGRTLELLIESSTVKDLAGVRATYAGTLHVIQPQSTLTDNSLRFDPQEMQGMLALGRIAGEVAWHEWEGENHDSSRA